MANSKSKAGLMHGSASIAHAFVREQVAAILAPMYLLHRRPARLFTAGPSAGQPVCRPTSAIDLQPTGFDRS